VSSSAWPVSHLHALPCHTHSPDHVPALVGGVWAAVPLPVRVRVRHPRAARAHLWSTGRSRAISTLAQGQRTVPCRPALGARVPSRRTSRLGHAGRAPLQTSAVLSAPGMVLWGGPWDGPAPDGRLLRLVYAFCPARGGLSMLPRHQEGSALCPTRNQF